MVKPLVKDTLLLQKKSVPVSRTDLQAVQDLIDTLNAHNETCVGMAGNMIGVQKRFLVFSAGLLKVPMLNPRIISHSEAAYETEEGCLCLSGTRPVRRYESITVKYQDLQFQWQTRSFSGFTAEIIQHEMDHFEGILI